MSIKIFYIIGLFLSFGCSQWHPPAKTSPPQNEKDTIFTIESLRQSNLPSGSRIKVQGIIICVSVGQTRKANQPGSGCYLIPQYGTSPFHTGLYIGDFEFAEYLNKRVIVEGEIFYLPQEATSSKRLVLRHTKVLRLLK